MTLIPLVALTLMAAALSAELRISRRQERRLRKAGASEPPGDVYRWMRLVYPACFIAMTIEGVVRARAAAGRVTPVTAGVIVAGGVVVLTSKALKYWAIASLGDRWSFRVLVRPGSPLVISGPYRWLRHPNYLAVIGELLGMALLVQAPVTGFVSLVVFGSLLKKRIAIEESALGLRAGTD